MNKAKVKRFMQKHESKYRNSFGELDIVELTFLALDEFELDFDTDEADVIEIAMELE